jgi:hypothetical protein
MGSCALLKAWMPVPSDLMNRAQSLPWPLGERGCVWLSAQCRHRDHGSLPTAFSRLGMIFHTGPFQKSETGISFHLVCGA